jgi:hypothetical protein
MSPTSVVAATEPAASTPRGSTIDVFNFGGGRCWRYRQHPQAAHHRCLQIRWWPLTEIPAAFPRGAAIDVFNFGGARCRRYWHHPSGGPAIDVFNFSGGRCRRYQQHSPGGPPSMSPTSGHLLRARRQHFLVLIVGAPRPPAPAPPGGPL